MTRIWTGRGPGLLGSRTLGAPLGGGDMAIGVGFKVFKGISGYNST